MKTRFHLLFGSFLVAATLMGLGCNPVAKIQEKAVEGIVERATGGNVDINTSNNSVSFKDEKTGATATYGEKVKLPADFPEDVPIIPEANVNSVGTTAEGVAVTLTVKGSAEKVSEWYSQRAVELGWKQESSYAVAGSDMRSFTKDGAALAVSVFTGEESETIVTIMKTIKK